MDATHHTYEKGFENMHWRKALLVNLMEYIGPLGGPQRTREG